MKNAATFEIKDINIVVEGQPINIQGCTIHYENEASVQELATGASFIKDMIHEIKDFVKEAQASAQQQYNNRIADTPTSTPATTAAKNKVETPQVAEPQKTNHTWDLPAVWEVMMKKLPEGFKKSGIGCYEFERGTIKDENKITVKIEFNEDSIDMDIYVGSTSIHGYLYSKGERSRVSGINPVLMQDVIEEMPEEIKEFVKDYFDKVNKN